MKRRLLVTATGLTVMLGATSAAYGALRGDVVAEGVRVAGIELGGLSRSGAERKLSRGLAGPLGRALTLRVGRRQFTLSARRSLARADVPAMVEDALEESRNIGPIGRALRDLTGQRVDADLPARVVYERRAVRAFTDRVERRVERPPRSARLRPSRSGPGLLPARRGVEVSGGALERVVARGLAGVRRRKVRAPARFSRPKVTTSELRDRYPRYVAVDRQGFRLRVYRSLRLERTHVIAVGQVGFDTPAGLYHVQNKGVNPTWQVPDEAWAGEKAGRTIPPGPENPIKARWMGIYDGAGIHGTDEIGSLGSRASHGCIRMAIPDVKRLYRKISVGTPVYIG